MITSVRAHLAISTDHPDRRVGPLTEILGVEPTTVWEMYDPWPSPQLPDRLRKFGRWSFHEGRTIASSEDPHGMESLVRLAERFEPKSELLAKISEEFEIEVVMSGSSDSGQAGFYVGPETMRRLGLLHASFAADLFLSEDMRASDFDD